MLAVITNAACFCLVDVHQREPAGESSDTIIHATCRSFLEDCWMAPKSLSVMETHICDLCIHLFIQSVIHFQYSTLYPTVIDPSYVSVVVSKGGTLCRSFQHLNNKFQFRVKGGRWCCEGLPSKYMDHRELGVSNMYEFKILYDT
jgi:hypothetical protein